MATFFGGGGGANADDIIAEIVDSAPETLNTLNELAAALNDDANFATTVVNSLASKADLVDGFVDPEQLDLTGLATESYVDTAISEIPTPDLTGKADLVNGFVDPSQLNNINVPGPQPTYLALTSFYNNNQSSTLLYSTDAETWDPATLPFSGLWKNAAFGDGKFVAIAQNTDKAAYSIDAVNWTQTNMPLSTQFPGNVTSWNSIVYGSGKFVATALNYGDAAYSADGINWTGVSTPNSQGGFTDLAYGNGVFVAVRSSFSNTAIYSQDGITWNEATLPLSSSWKSVAYGNGKFVAVAGTTSPDPTNTFVVYSTDGANWTQASTPNLPNGSNSSRSIAYGDNKFVIVQNNSATGIYSADGVNWTTMSLPFGNPWDDLSYGNLGFIASSFGTFAYSLDGISWTYESNSLFNEYWELSYGEPLIGIAPGPIASEAHVAQAIAAIDFPNKADLVDGFVDPSQLDEILSEISSPLYLAVGRANDTNLPSAYYSPDAITWTRSTMPGQVFDSFYQCSAFGNGKIVALGSRSMGSQSLAAYSTDGTTWTSSTMPVETSWTSVTYAAGKFVAVSRGAMGAGSSNAAYSTDGISWTAATLPRSAIWQSVTYGNGKFVAVGREFMSGLDKAAYSTDGITWLEATLPSSAQWISVTYAAGKFVAVSPYSVGAYSTDGITWTASNLSQSFAWSSVTYGNGKFVAVIGRNDVSDIVAYSTDGISWSTSVLPSSQSWVSVTFGNGKFVAVSDTSGISPVYSTDGVSWTAASNQSETGLWQSIAYGEPTEIAPSPIASEAYVDSISDSLQTALDGKANSSHTHNMGQIVTTVTDKASAYTIAAADENTFIRSTSATAVNMTINNVLNIGESVQFIQFGAGQITFVAGSGVNLRSVDNKLKTNKQYSVAAVTCVASGEYLVTGDLVA